MRARLFSLSLLFALACGDARAADEKQRLCLSTSETAQRLRIAGKLRDARDRFLQCAREECPVVVRQDCEASLAEVEGALPTVIVVARDASGRDVRKVRVIVDGALLVDGLDGRSVAVDPGAHTFRYEAEGYAAVEEPIVVREGEKQRLLEVRFGSPTREQASPPPIGAFVLAGISTVALGVGTYFGVRALADYQSMRDGCGATRTCSNDEAASVRGRAIVADVSLGVALVCGAISAWLFLRRSPATTRVMPGTAGVAATF